MKWRIRFGCRILVFLINTNKIYQELHISEGFIAIKNVRNVGSGISASNSRILRCRRFQFT
jgi:hypothetical protein